MLDQSVVMAKPLPRNVSELAINGAKPAFVAPLHVGRPNVVNRERFLQLTSDLLDRLWLSNNGPLVQEFERRLAAFMGVKHCIAVCNATIGLEIAMQYSSEYTENVHSYVNNINTTEGGTHVSGFRSALTRSLDADKT